jgi:hypothetical protein
MVKKTDQTAMATDKVQLPDSARDWSYAANGDKTPEGQLTGNTEQSTGETEQTISPEVADFYNRYRLALEAWVKTHGPKAAPPVYVDPIDGKMKWANREMRKRAAKRRLKAKKV